MDAHFTLTPPLNGWRHCPDCCAQRPDTICWKCKTPTNSVPVEWEYPAMPSVDAIRALAKEVGYAIGVHGSLQSDLDLIAAPWTEEAVSAAELFAHVAAGMNARVLDTELKPLGRIAASVQIDGYYKTIDLSVCPKA